ncbi:hypothetical protein [Capnocytophaga canimorsus]|uniref:hypothetical protein n=1 Tax=Capnocytophaga canimorsus TaxID=28188 RepID=UPI0037D7B8E0
MFFKKKLTTILSIRIVRLKKCNHFVHYTQKAEKLAKQCGITSIKIDTNFDNYAMLKVLEKAKYTHCGTVYFRGASRMAFEKLLETD